MDQRIRDDTHNPAIEVCGHKDDLLYGSKTGSHISGDIATQRLEKMGEVMPIPRVTNEAPDETSPRR